VAAWAASARGLGLAAAASGTRILLNSLASCQAALAL
jgi:hypothetical protein